MIKPTQDYILVEPEAEEASNSGLYIPEKQQSNYGIVKARGIEVKNINTGDKVFFKQYSAIEIDDLLLLKEEDILAVIGKQELNCLLTL